MRLLHLSLPVRECGLKLNQEVLLLQLHQVTPRAGVWVEMGSAVWDNTAICVTPRAGVWVDIVIPGNIATGIYCHSPCGSVG